MSRVTDLLTRSITRHAAANMLFLWVFMSAWLADIYPSLTSYMIGLSVISILIYIVGLYIAAKRIELGRRAPEVVVPVVNNENLYSRNTLALLYAETMREHHFHSHVVHSPRSSNISSWAFSARSRELMHIYDLIEYNRRITRDIELAKIAKVDQLSQANWSIVLQGKNAFTVMAGPVEIEQFQGRINIRIIHEDGVTIEGAARGSKADVPGFTNGFSPTYN